MRRKFNAIPKLHIKKDDTVLVLSGDDKGKTGKVTKVLPMERKAFVQGINLVTKHRKVSAQYPDGGRITEEAPIFVSKLMVIEPKSGKPSRVGRVANSHGKLVRTTKRSGEEI